jgi:hypothetical protein
VAAVFGDEYAVCSGRGKAVVVWRQGAALSVAKFQSVTLLT